MCLLCPLGIELVAVFFSRQKTEYEMRISDWSSDVCSSDLTRYVARDVSTLYRAAQDRLDRGQYKLAAALFDEVERQHPYSPWARRAQLMSAFSYYMDREYTPAIAAAQRFLAIHPGNKDAQIGRASWRERVCQ